VLQRDTLGRVKIRPKTAEELEDTALYFELKASGALDSPDLYTVEDLERIDEELRAQGK
jgi:hypothetical protein